MDGAQKSYDGVSGMADASTSRTGNILRTDGPGIRIRGATMTQADETRFASGNAADVMLLLKNEIVSKHAQAHIISRLCDGIVGHGVGAPFTVPEQYAVALAIAGNPSFSDTKLQERLIIKYMFHNGIMAELAKNPEFTDDNLIRFLVKSQATDPEVMDEMLKHKEIDESTENEIARSSALSVSTCYYLSVRPMYGSTIEILKSGDNPFKGEWLDHVKLKENAGGIAIQRDGSDNAGIAHMLPAA